MSESGSASGAVGDGSRRGTLAAEVSRRGRGLHTGREVEARLLPAEEGRGVVFRRVDLDGDPEVRARVDRVTSAEWETVLEDGPARVGAAEHMLSALHAAGIDDVTVELDGPEPPALDGSALPWCEAVEEAGVRRSGAEAPVFAPEQAFTVEEGESLYTVSPAARLRVSAEIEFDNPAIGRQFASGEVGPEPFCRELAPARTFGLEAWREEFRERGLARGASHENTILVGEEGLDEDAPDLRFPGDEFVRHKLVDLVGDLALFGARLRAHVVAERPSHRGNVALVRELVRRREAAERDGPVLDIDGVLDVLPHAYPFLLVDRILEYEEGRRIVGLKNVTINEPFFPGHFPGHPIMPGVLIVEAMAQVGGLLFMNEFDAPEEKILNFMSIDDVRFRRPVRPGDQLRFDVELAHSRGRVSRMEGTAYVEDTPAAEATFLGRVVDR